MTSACMRAVFGSGAVTSGPKSTARGDGGAKMRTWRATRVVMRGRVVGDTNKFAFLSTQRRVGSAFLGRAGGAARQTRRVGASESHVDQLERQVREDPVRSSNPSVTDGDGASDGSAKDKDTKTASSNKPGNTIGSTSTGTSTGTSSNPPSSNNNRQPLGPGRRFLLKAKLYFLLLAGGAVSFFQSLFKSRAFIAVFAVFIASSGLLTVKAAVSKRATLKAQAPQTVLYSQFTKDLAAKRVKQVRFEEGTSRILYELNVPPPTRSKADKASLAPKANDAKADLTTAAEATKAKVTATKPHTGAILATKRVPDEKLMTRMEAAGVDFGSIAAPATSYLSKGALTAFALWIPLIPLYFIMRNMANKQNGSDAGKKAKRGGAVDPSQRVTFADVAGVDEAKAELVELVEMLKSADKYKNVRGRLPTGCLLVGPPGTGKTLLAKAVAGEANVPFFSVAASEFVELFVGRGAARVRELFAEARKNSPSVIFIDELDAIGARRGAGLNEERDQTLNQMLVEMDGFNKPGGVLVLAATNRAEALDPALLRPGRLTRRVFVGPPDFKGRCQIMRVHLRGVATDTSLDLTVETVAKLTPGFTGAELANVVNEACLLAARDDREVVTLDDFAKGAERTKNGVGVGKGAASVLSRLRELVTRNDGWGGEGGGSDDGNGGGNGGGGGSNREGGAAHKVPEGNKKQGVGLSMPPT